MHTFNKKVKVDAVAGQPRPQTSVEFAWFPSLLRKPAELAMGTSVSVQRTGCPGYAAALLFWHEKVETHPVNIR